MIHLKHAGMTLKEKTNTSQQLSQGLTMLQKFAVSEGSTVFRLIYNKKSNTYDIENGLMELLTKAPLLTHDESMAFIHKYSHDNGILSMKYTLIERDL